MHIIGFAGKSGSGKTTAAKITLGILTDMGYSAKLDTFADPVRKAAIKKFGSIYVGNVSQRGWMQWKADEIRRESPHYFVNQFMLRNNLDLEYEEQWEPADYLIVHDLRMPDEVKFCSDHGVVVFMMGTHRPLPESLAGHRTEQAIDGLLHGADYFISQQPDKISLITAIREMIEGGHHIRKQGAGEPAAMKGL